MVAIGSISGSWKPGRGILTEMDGVAIQPGTRSVGTPRPAFAHLPAERASPLGAHRAETSTPVTTADPDVLECRRLVRHRCDDRCH